jgi:chromosome partitioning protein
MFDLLIKGFYTLCALAAFMSQKIAFVNGKGGTGKTTLSMLVAGVLKERNHNVGIDDRDPQGNATAVAESYGIPLNPNADFVIIDTAPDIDDDATVDAIRQADIVAVVLRPELFDFMSTAATAKVIQRERRPDAKTVVIFNQVRPQTLVAKEILEAKGKIPFPVLNTVIHLRAAYSRANRYGWKALPKEERVELVKLCIELLA